MIDRAPPVDQAVRVRTTLIPGDGVQDAAIQAVLAETFSAGGSASRHTLRAGELRLDGSTETPAIVESVAGLEDSAVLVSGAWPTGAAASGAVPTAVQADAAIARGLELGDTVVVGNPGAQTTLVVAATWRVTDPADPLWFADPATLSGFDGRSTGPFVVSEADLRALPVTVTAEWTATPRGTAFGATELRSLADHTDATALAAAVRVAGGIDGGNLTVDGGLSATSRRVLTATLGVTAIAVLPQLLLLLLGTICVSQLARLLGSARAAETTVLRARGASRAQLSLVSALEVLLVVGLGCLAGLALAGLALALLGLSATGAAATGAASTGGRDAAGSLADAFGLAAGAGALLALVTLARLAAGYGGSRASGTDGRAADPAGTTAPRVIAVVVGLVALLSLWQLLAGGGLLTGVSGTAGLNPLAAPAPVLVLVAVTLVLGLGVGPLARAVTRSRENRRTFAVFQVARVLGRPPSSFPVIVLVVALATGGSVLSAAVGSTWNDTDTKTRLDTVGADVRIRLDAPDFDAENSPAITSAPYAALPGVESATVTFASPVAIGGDTATLLGVAPGSHTATPPAGITAEGLVDPAADSVAVTLGSDGQGRSRAGSITVSGWFADAQGALSNVSLGAVAVDTLARFQTTLVGELPPGIRPLRLLALDVRLAGSPGEALAVTLSEVQGRDAVGTASPIDLGTDPTRQVSVSSAKALGRVLAQPPASAAPDPVPVIATHALMERAGLALGAPVELTLPTGRTLTAVLSESVPGVAGAGSAWAVVADLPTLDRALLAAGDPVMPPAEVWVGARSAAGAAGDPAAGDPAAGDPAAIASGALALGHYRTTATTTLSASAAPLRGPTVLVLRVVAGSGGLIALVAFIASALVLLRSRRSEALALDALGLSLRSHGYQRAAELVTLVVWGVVAGAAAGLTAALLAVRPFAVAASPGAVSAAGVSFDALWVTVALGALGAGLFAVAALYVAAVQRQVRAAQRPTRRPPTGVAR